MKGTAAIVTLGCKTNQFESTVMEQELKGAGYTIVPFESGADLVIVNTCTVTSATDSQSRQMVRRSHRLNPQARVVVTGCYAQINPDVFRDMEGVGLVLGNNEKEDLLKYLESDSEECKVHVSDIRSNCREIFIPFVSSPHRSRAFLQIQNGCDAFCSYCIIPYARGKSRSLSAADVLQKMESLVADGFQEIVLTGIHLGDYGHDFIPGMTFTDLVASIENQALVKRLRIGSLEPNEIPDRLIELAANSPRICPHFHIPLQAGDNRVLARMKRPYTREFFKELILKINDQIENVAVGIDVITGFPGETDGEFQKTFDLIDSLPVSYLHVFPFSSRPGTEAAQMPGHVSSPLIKERAACLRDLGEKKHFSYMQKYLKKPLDVVVEGRVKGAFHRGLSRNYLPVLFSCSKQLEGQIVTVIPGEITPEGLVGKLL